MLVLIGSWAGSLAIGVVIASVRPTGRPLQALLFAHIPVALTFWVWALFHCVSSSFDGGVVTFLFSAIAGVHGHLKGTLDHGALRRQRWLTGLSGGLVVANYLGGVVIAVKKSMANTIEVYYGIAAVVWLVATTGALWLLAARLRSLEGAGNPLLNPR